ncbi:UNVERIFIED_CONTAM: 5'-deoxynucleotidase hdd1 [Sesamum calycinum]|uniref:5'-deoxynucleotidase n=1 Tax=Sesamum calycinum TaxID=2727403 RepID=A0AAW2QXR7_9LAMI
MASVAAARANPSSLSHTNFQRLNSSHKFSIKIPFFSDPPTPRIVSLHSNNPSLDSMKMDRAVSGFGSGSGSSAHAHSSSSPASAIDFLTLCHRLKSTKRKGWINHGIKGPESIADHMYRMALMALIADDLPGVNRERCVKIAIVHDIAEVGIFILLAAEEIKELWLEYENNSSLEANLVKDFDKVEMILQALEYETEHGKVLDEFFLSAAGKIQTEIGKKWAAEITSRRNSRSANQPN